MVTHRNQKKTALAHGGMEAAVAFQRLAELREIEHVMKSAGDDLCPSTPHEEGCRHEAVQFRRSLKSAGHRSLDKPHAPRSLDLAPSSIVPPLSSYGHPPGLPCPPDVLAGMTNRHNVE